MTEQFSITNNFQFLPSISDHQIFRVKHSDYMYIQVTILIIFNYTQVSYFIDLDGNLQFVEMLLLEVLVIHLNTIRILDNYLHPILLLEQNTLLN